MQNEISGVEQFKKTQLLTRILCPADHANHNHEKHGQNF